MQPIPQAGRLVAIVGPSGGGKDTLIGGLLATHPEIHRVRRTISRPAAAETEDFESVTAAEFTALDGAGRFALRWSAHGLEYGIRHRELAPLAAGRTVIFNGSRKALAEAVAAYPQLHVVQIAVSPEVLAQRLSARGRESADDILRRLARADLALPIGITATTVWNDSTPAEGIARLIDALQPVRA
ncbi:phosphonate metabolism protein/1,5-bisphosphokinase (PRPP-forming) PhnN [Sinirhodobacter sp. WL0062]|uniref:Ribose 1,5-bisphosphate phosphokinase PhnN n=1 Tax=Rhodobacter flavimaris TaxID=2907145 RepID=A0ABS8Z0D6_9RHOB|nr:phosphonate metabolism protein/1,5-bisphosphokinase (PRPP-forming) PhnN [Sinirhodobacter sp. WL0062]MCE5974995.1 phosphonate metabolism protein/1,5-bisphosphokinase (PRPP-forming) PhnN [Sinirhodobacter sp. WL0062]